MAVTALAVIAPSLPAVLLCGGRLRCVQPKWNNGCVVDRGRLLWVGEDGSVGGALVTISAHMDPPFFSYILLEAQLLTPVSSSVEQPTYIFAWNESNHPRTRQRMYCLLVLHSETLSRSLKVISIDFFLVKFGESPTSHPLTYLLLTLNVLPFSALPLIGCCAMFGIFGMPIKMSSSVKNKIR